MTWIFDSSFRNLFTLTIVVILAATSSQLCSAHEQQQHGLSESLTSLKRRNVTIMAYNVNHLHYVFQMTIRPRNEGERLKRLNNALRTVGRTAGTVQYGVPDVVVLTEVMSNSASRELSELVDLYPYQTSRLGNDCKDQSFDSMTGCKQILLNGGVKILSKFPILSTDGLVFTHRMNGDQLVNKGALRVRVRDPDTGVVFNVVGTHMQSTDTPLQKSNVEERIVRKHQMIEILDWIKNLTITQDESVFICGDYNVEFDTPEYHSFMVDLPLQIKYRKDENVGGSFSAKFRGDATNWLTAYHLYGSNVSQIDETLDFIAVVTDYGRPVEMTPMKVVPLKSGESWSWWRMKGEWKINGTVYYHSGYYRDLSDHYPVVQSFVVESLVDPTVGADDHVHDARPS